MIDTNVLLSGLFFGGVPGTVLDAWRAGRITVAVSDDILEEYWRAAGELAESFPTVDAEPFLELVEAEATMVDSSSFEVQVCDDPDDDKFLACAVASEAAYVITGDNALLRIGEFRGARVLTPRKFIDEISSR